MSERSLFWATLLCLYLHIITHTPSIQISPLLSQQNSPHNIIINCDTILATRRPLSIIHLLQQMKKVKDLSPSLSASHMTNFFDQLLPYLKQSQQSVFRIQLNTQFNLSHDGFDGIRKPSPFSVQFDFSMLTPEAISEILNVELNVELEQQSYNACVFIWGSQGNHEKYEQEGELVYLVEDSRERVSTSKAHKYLLFRPHYDTKVVVYRYSGYPYIASYICHQHSIATCVKYSHESDLTVSQYLKKYPQYLEYLKQRRQTTSPDQIKEIESKYSNVPTFPLYFSNVHETIRFEYCSKCYVLLHLHSEREALLDVTLINQKESQREKVSIEWQDSLYFSSTNLGIQKIRGIGGSYIGKNLWKSSGMFSKGEQLQYGFRYFKNLSIQGPSQSTQHLQYYIPLSSQILINHDLPVLLFTFISYTFSYSFSVLLLLNTFNPNISMMIECSSKASLYQINSSTKKQFSILLSSSQNSKSQCNLSFQGGYSHKENLQEHATGILQISKSPILHIHPNLIYPLYITRKQAAILHLHLVSNSMNFTMKLCSQGRVTFNIYEEGKLWSKKSLKVIDNTWSYQLPITDDKSNKEGLNLIIELEADTYSYLSLEYHEKESFLLRMKQEQVSVISYEIRLGSLDQSRSELYWLSLELQYLARIDQYELEIWGWNGTKNIDAYYIEAYCPSREFFLPHKPNVTLLYRQDCRNRSCVQTSIELLQKVQYFGVTLTDTDQQIRYISPAYLIQLSPVSRQLTFIMISLIILGLILVLGLLRITMQTRQQIPKTKTPNYKQQ